MTGVRRHSGDVFYPITGGFVTDTRLNPAERLSRIELLIHFFNKSTQIVTH